MESGNEKENLENLRKQLAVFRPILQEIDAFAFCQETSWNHRSRTRHDSIFFNDLMPEVIGGESLFVSFAFKSSINWSVGIFQVQFDRFR